MDWSPFFPDIMSIHKKEEERDELYDPGTACNLCNFLNKLKHWEGGGKGNKNKIIYYSNSFQLLVIFCNIEIVYKYIITVKKKLTHSATRRRSDAVTKSLCTSQRHRSYVSNETLNNVSVERRQDVSVVRFHDIVLQRSDDVSRGCRSSHSQMFFKAGVPLRCSFKY